MNHPDPSGPLNTCSPNRAVTALSILSGIFLLFAGCDKSPQDSKTNTSSLGTTPATPAKTPTPEDDAKLISSLVTSEETHLKLAPRLQLLAHGLMNLRLPGPGSEKVFADAVTISDLGPAPLVSDASLELRSWPMAEGIRQATNKLELWHPLLDSVSYFEHTRFHLMTGEHPENDLYRFESKAIFQGLAQTASGEWRSLHGKIKVNWQRAKATPEQPQPDWQITHWITEEFQWIASPRRLFVEVLDKALGTPQEVAALRNSFHHQAAIKFYQGGMKNLPHPYFAPISANQKEGLAIADINGDGFDDIYITVRLGKNMLLRNRGDGTFIEEAAKYGLDLPGHTTCALFADFDNDGDLDAMLGRSLLKSTYLENRNGRYHQPPIPGFMPMAAISMAAADYNKDGLLDIYICTYRPAAPMSDSPAGGVSQADSDGFDWPDEFFAPDLAREYKKRVAEHRKRSGGTVLDQLGPPNVLLVNRGGGKFEPAPENTTIGLWRNSLQATWGDYDDDGDPDLFVSNDWAPSNLFRNDGSTGFKDISDEVGVGYYGFSMGVSWGDYDNDGLEDLYVSNMYSDPGRRITSKIPGLGKMFVESAEGNWLYHKQQSGNYKLVSGVEPPAMTVMNAGWSWGGCFVDFNNDRYLDLYVLSGYFTPPKGLSSGIDLDSNLWRTTVRTDQNMVRQSFRFSPEWKRTPPPDSLGPEIDARLSGVDRQGDKIIVHPLNGSERNRYFANQNGKSFLDISALTGMDNIADSRGFAVLDYDRDGWQDVALVNANEPLFNLYHNEMASIGMKGGMVAIKFVGGNKTPTPNKEFTARDGFGARVKVDLRNEKLIREHRCGEGWATQNSPTMIVGIGNEKLVPSISVRWPSGKTVITENVPEGTLLTVYENVSDSPDGKQFTRQDYRAKVQHSSLPRNEKPVFTIAAVDPAVKPGTKLRVYTTFGTEAQGFKDMVPLLNMLKNELADEGVDVIVVPISESDDNRKLAAFAKEHRPIARLINLAPATRKDALTSFSRVLGAEASVPSTVVTDGKGHLLESFRGVPTISEVRKLLPK